MAIQFWKDLSILEGGVELAGHGKNVQVSAECAALDSTPLNTQGWTTVVGGNKTGTVTLDFMQDFAVASAIDSTLWANFGQTGVVRTLVTASADGSVAYSMKGIELQYTPLQGAPGELAMGRIQSTVSEGPLVRGTLLHPSNVARTSSSTGSAHQVGALSGSQRLWAALHVISATGTTPTLDVKVQSDNASNFPSATDRITFTQATEIGGQMLSVDGAITDDYWRVSYTIGGTGPSFAFAVTAGIISI